MIFLRWKLQSQYEVLIWSFLLPLKKVWLHNSTFLIKKELNSDKANRDLPKIWLLAVSCISLSEKSHEFRQNSFESKLRGRKIFPYQLALHNLQSQYGRLCCLSLVNIKKFQEGCFQLGRCQNRVTISAVIFFSLVY